MAKWQGRSLTKPTGGRIKPARRKRRREIGGEFIEVRLGAVEKIRQRVYGGGVEPRLLGADIAVVADPKTGQAKCAKILSVVENPADPHFVRRNVVTRGAIIETELGRARVTSRPGRDGVVNAVLLGVKEAEKPVGEPASQK